MKTFVITLSKTFPRTHIHSGRETNFAHLLGNEFLKYRAGKRFSQSENGRADHTEALRKSLHGSQPLTALGFRLSNLKTL